MTMAARFNGQVFVPDEPVELPVGRKVRVEVEPIDGYATTPTRPARKARRSRMIRNLSCILT